MAAGGCQLMELHCASLLNCYSGERRSQLCHLPVSCLELDARAGACCAAHVFAPAVRRCAKLRSVSPRRIRGSSRARQALHVGVTVNPANVERSLDPKTRGGGWRLLSLPGGMCAFEIISSHCRSASRLGNSCSLSASTT